MVGKINLGDSIDNWIKLGVLLVVASGFMGSGGLIATAFACLAGVTGFPSWLTTFFASGGLVYLLLGLGLFIVVLRVSGVGGKK